MDFSSKLKRSANFSAAETDFLVSLVKKHKSVIECMKTDTVNAKIKKEAWISIQDEFNSQSMENPRTALILKNKYNNIKQVVKKHYADEKVFRRGTGGGPTRLFPESSTATTVGEILQIKMTGEPAVFDSDYVDDTWETNLMENENNECINDEQIISVNFEDIDPEESELVWTPHIPAYLKSTPPLMDTITSAASAEPYNSEAVNNKSISTKKYWKTYTPADLKSKSSLTASSASAADGHVTKKHKVYQDKITSWASSRASFTEQQQIAFMEQHKLKMTLMREKQETEIKMMTEKHNAEMGNLQLQRQILLLKKEKEKL